MAARARSNASAQRRGEKGIVARSAGRTTAVCALQAVEDARLEAARIVAVADVKKHFSSAADVDSYVLKLCKHICLTQIHPAWLKQNDELKRSCSSRVLN